MKPGSEAQQWGSELSRFQGDHLAGSMLSEAGTQMPRLPVMPRREGRERECGGTEPGPPQLKACVHCSSAAPGLSSAAPSEAACPQLWPLPRGEAEPVPQPLAAPSFPCLWWWTSLYLLFSSVVFCEKEPRSFSEKENSVRDQLIKSQERFTLFC